MPANVFLTQGRARQFSALQNYLVPLSQEFTDVEIAQSQRLVNDLLAGKPNILHLKIVLFMWVIDCVSFLLGFSSFAGLTPHKKNLVMDFYFLP